MPKRTAKNPTRVALEDRCVRDHMSLASFERLVREAWKRDDPTGSDLTVLRRVTETALGTLRAAMSNRTDSELLELVAKGGRP